MRITTRMLSEGALRGMAANLERIERLQSQVSGGTRLTRPSDDPRALARALDLRAAISAGEQHLRTIDSARAWLDASETALASATERLQRARELAVEGANDTLGGQERWAIAAEVDQILEGMVALGNTTVHGQRLFAGTQTGTDPFTLSVGPPPSVAYSGDANQLPRKIGTNTTLVINVPGSTWTDAFSALIALRDALQTGTAATIRDSMGSIDAAMDTLLASRAQVGAKVNLLEALQERQRSFQVHLTELLSREEDTDMAQAISELTIQETVYRAALSVVSRAIQPSLLDFLR